LLLHHGNTPYHTSFFSKGFLTRNNMTIIPHPPYSSDLAPCHISLFLWLKMKSSCRYFDKIEVIETESQVVLKTFTDRLPGCI
jgi:hypothetical protein